MRSPFKTWPGKSETSGNDPSATPRVAFCMKRLKMLAGMLPPSVRTTRVAPEPATVEMIPKTIVEVGNVGVVVSYTGDVGKDLSGEEYKHGEMVSQGSRGVWSTPLLPGKYAFNTYAGNIILVPTTNFVLHWVTGKSESHQYDDKLQSIDLVTKDAFEPSLPLSVVVHIDYRQAPLVIQRFGDVKRLVEQTLDPMVAAYFKN